MSESAAAFNAAVVEALRTWPALAGVSVYDGPQPTSASDPDMVLVGSTGEDDEDGLTVDHTPSDLGPGRWIAEAGELLCSVFSWDGGTDAPAIRARAAAHAQSCAAAIAAADFGALIQRPRVSSYRYRVQQSQSGVIVRVLLTVSFANTLT